MYMLKHCIVVQDLLPVLPVLIVARLLHPDLSELPLPACTLQLMSILSSIHCPMSTSCVLVLRRECASRATLRCAGRAGSF